MGVPAKKIWIKPRKVDFDRMKITETVDTGSGWFDGRARRSEYWTRWIIMQLIVLFVVLPLILVPLLKIGFDTDVREFPEGAILSIVSGLLVLIVCKIAMWPVTVRRFHDRGMSGWWILWFWLLFGIPFVGWFVIPIVKFVILGCMDGVPGPNAYGPDPKGRKGDRNYATQDETRPVIRIVNTNNVNAATASNVKERLAKLEELKGKGMISEREYLTKRSQILSDL